MITRLIVATYLLWNFVRVRWGYRFVSRSALLAWQARRLRKFMRHTLTHIPYYNAYRERPLEQWPVVSKASMLKNFALFNAPGITMKEALHVASQAERERNFKPSLPGGVTVGLSSGTSGERGVFLVSARERGIWAGVMLGRVLNTPSLRQMLTPWASPLTVAFFLRANSKLYTTVNGRRLHFVYFDLLAPMSAHLHALDALKPDILIAPASVLGHLAACQRMGTLLIQPRQVISVAEVLEADDAQAAQTAWGGQVAQIYQCTEGFLAVSCPSGNLHLNEEHIHVEAEWLDAERTRFVPLITDFTRHTQAFVRYRLDDVLHVAPQPCPCGRVALRLLAVEGRQDDVLWLPGAADGVLRPMFADVVRRAMALAQATPAMTGAAMTAGVDEYRLEQHGMQWTVRLHFTSACAAETVAPVSDAIARELRAVCQTAELQIPDIAVLPWIEPPRDTKRRRIRCMHRPVTSI